MQEYYHTGILFVVALSWIKIIESLVKSKIISIEVSRKSIHVGIGVLYLLCWGIYDVSCENCRYLAALVPSAVVIKFILIVCKIIDDKITVKMLCRDESRPKQLLYGPLMYGFVIIFSTIYYWLYSMEGITMIIILCVGDGMAALGGKFIPICKLPWNKQKSLGGSLTFIIFSYFSLIFFISWFYSLGYVGLYQFLDSYFYVKLLIICAFSSFIESFPLGEFDNLIVPAAAFFCVKVLF